MSQNMKNMRKSFKEYVVLKEATGATDWKAESAAPPLQKGFIPPPKMRPIVRAFASAEKIPLTTDTGDKPPTMPKKALYLAGEAVREFIRGKPVRNYELVTDATPEQTAHILTHAGFRHGGDRSGVKGDDLLVPKEFMDADGNRMRMADAQPDDKLVWYVKQRDGGKKPFAIGVSVDGEEFEISTMRKDARGGGRPANVEFANNPKDDAGGRDLTMNSMYIELSKPDAPNTTLYDPAKTGYHDTTQGVVKAVGKAEERFAENPLRVLQAVRLHCKYGKGELGGDMAKAIQKFPNLHEKVDPKAMRDEFLSGLLDPDVDPRKYLAIYKKTGILASVFPGLTFDPPAGVPAEFSDKKDKPLALAWLLQHNPVDKVGAALSATRSVGGQDRQTGWQAEERNAVLFLLRMKEFTPEKAQEYASHRQGTGLTNDQLRDWVDMFKRPGTQQHRRPWWAANVKKFVSAPPQDDHKAEPPCQGPSCGHSYSA